VKSVKRERSASPQAGAKVPKVEEGQASVKEEANTKEDPEKKPAKVYPFELDGFQKEAIGYLEKNESVLVAAHTSAGKTSVAEYAIAMALRDNQRVIYTSPIKALSNQKYRDLAEEFSDVGLMTGDVTINPNASCLVMTTEILRSMLYRGSEVVREVAYAIFDEVHYMRDKERGVVWEESIVLLPHKVRYVFLSATIPNAQQFCDWISKVHHQPCHAVYTNYRPTPLQHYVYPSGSSGVYLIVDEKGKFHDDTFQKAMSTLATSTLEDEINDGLAKSKEARKRMQNRRRDKLGDLLSIIQMIMQRNYDPAIVFSFSKKDCEKYAAQCSKLSFNSPEDKQLVTQVFNNAMDSLNDDDKELPQVKSYLPLLQKGIGIHHGGLLPILKEVTEILFGEGLLKVLFATETFAMGINMPAKTVVFTAMRKYDGSDFRWVGPGEYIQMSGRAGRRGLDDRGIVIQMIEEQMEPEQAKSIMSGQALPLSSTFHLGYNMLLNLMRVEDADPEFIIRHSLYTFQQECAVPQLEENLRVSQAEAETMTVPDEAALARFHHMKNQIVRVDEQLQRLVYTPQNIHGFLKTGRLVALTAGWSWGIVLSVDHLRGKDSKKVPENLKVLVAGNESGDTPFQWEAKDATAVPVVKLFKLSDITTVSSLRVHTPSDLRLKSNLEAILSSLKEVRKRFSDGEIPLLDPLKDLKIKDSNLSELISKRKQLFTLLKDDPIQALPFAERVPKYNAYIEKHNVLVKVKLLKKEIKEKKNLPMKEKLVSMKTVLRRLGHVDKDSVIQLKGRVACEISSGDELVLTELLLGGAFNDLEPAQAGALLTCMVFTDPGDTEVVPSTELQPAFRTMQAAAKRVAEIQNEAGITLDVEEFAKKFRPDLMDPVLQWCRGSKFSEVCEGTEVFEGTIIRCVRRLVELLRQLCVASKVIGDATLEGIFTKAIELIKRDIIFAASLYL